MAGYVFGHASDGILHNVLVGDSNDEETYTRLEIINRRIVRQASFAARTGLAFALPLCLVQDELESYIRT